MVGWQFGTARYSSTGKRYSAGQVKSSLLVPVFWFLTLCALCGLLKHDVGSKEVEEDGDEDKLSTETGDDDQDDQVGNSDYQGLVLDFS